MNFMWNIFWEADFIGKLVLVCLGLSSIYTWSVIIAKIFVLTKHYILIKEFKEFVYQSSKLARLIVEDSCMHSQVYDDLINSYKTGEISDAKFQMILDKHFFYWEAILEKKLDYLSIIGSISPFVGLFGTVWGIMNSFKSIAESNSSSISIVAPGLSEALFATAVGLFVAIPAVIGTNLIYAKIEALQKDLKNFGYYILKRLEN